MFLSKVGLIIHMYDRIIIFNKNLEKGIINLYKANVSNLHF